MVDHPTRYRIRPNRIPNARYFQYKLNLTTTVDASPIVQSVDVAYLLPNLPPVIKSVKVTIGGKSSPAARAGRGRTICGLGNSSGRYQTITWDGSDPNGDVVIYSLYYRTGMSSPWILLKDKLKETNFELGHTIGSGREVRSKSFR